MDELPLTPEELYNIKEALKKPGIILPPPFNIVDEKIEARLERLWKLEGGVDPETGEMWLTPRMERDATKIKEHLDGWEEKRKNASNI